MSTIMIVDHDSIIDSLRNQGVPANPAQIARWLRGAAELFDPQADLVAYGTWFQYPEEATADGEVIPSSSTAFGAESFQMHHADSRDEIDEQISDRFNELHDSTYTQAIVVSNNRAMAKMAETMRRAKPDMTIRIWGTSDAAPSLRKEHLNFVDLQERLDLKVKKGVLVIDWENLFISLRKQGYTIPVNTIIEIVNEFADRQAQIVERLAFADFGALARVHGPEVFEMQRQLELNHITTRYVVSTTGKNSADMRIVNELGSIAPKANADIVVLVSSDQDFRPAIEALQRRRVKVVVLAMQGATSVTLTKMTGVRLEMLEDHLPAEFKRKPVISQPADGQALSTYVRLAVIINSELRSHNWQWISEENAKRALIEVGGFGSPAEVDRTIREAIDEGMLSKITPQSANGAEVLRLEVSNEIVQTALTVMEVIRQRMEYTHNVKGYPSVREGYIIRGLNEDERLKKHNILLSPVIGRAWLDFATARGVLAVETFDDDKKPGRTVNMYKLNEQSAVGALSAEADDLDTMVRRLITNYDQLNLVNGHGWAALKTLDTHLSPYGRTTFFRVVDKLIEIGAAQKKQYPNNRPDGHPVSGLEIDPESSIAQELRAERRAVLEAVWQFHKHGQPINLPGLNSQPQIQAMGEQTCRMWLNALNGERILAHIGGTEAGYRLNALHPIVRMEAFDTLQFTRTKSSEHVVKPGDLPYTLHPAA